MNVPVFRIEALGLNGKAMQARIRTQCICAHKCKHGTNTSLGKRIHVRVTEHTQTRRHAQHMKKNEAKLTQQLDGHHA